MKQEKMNGGEVYFSAMHEVSPRVISYIEDQIDSTNIQNSQLRETVGLLPHRRKKSLLMRPNLTYLTYRNLDGIEKIEDMVPALAISELSNYQAYLDNWVFDNKNGTLSDRKRLNLVIAGGEVLRELTQRVIDDLNVPEIERRKISKKLSIANIGSYDAQARDFTLNISQIGSFENEGEFVADYLDRSRMLSGLLYGFSTELGAIIAGAGEEDMHLARNLGELIGTGMQVSNDLADFVISLGGQSDLKATHDQLADIRGGRLTLPIYYTLTFGSEVERNALLHLVENENASEEELFGASQALITSGAYEKCIKVLNGYRLQIKHTTKQLPENKWQLALRSVSDTVRRNKYISALIKLRDEISERGVE